jgi:hypothetical protein
MYFMNEREAFLEGKPILCIEELSNQRLIACVNDDFNMRVIDLNNK